jgi:hypothetical protein
VVSVPFDNDTLASSTGAPTYTMNESHGALAPAASELMKLPSFVAGAAVPVPIIELLSGSLSNHPARTPVVVFFAVDMFVLKLNEIVSGPVS